MEVPSGTTHGNELMLHWLVCTVGTKFMGMRTALSKNMQKPEFVKSYLTFHVPFLIFSVTTRINKGLRRQHIALTGNCSLLLGPAATSQQVLPWPEILNMSDPREIFPKSLFMGMPVLLRIGGIRSPTTMVSCHLLSSNPFTSWAPNKSLHLATSSCKSQSSRALIHTFFVWHIQKVEWEYLEKFLENKNNAGSDKPDIVTLLKCVSDLGEHNKQN